MITPENIENFTRQIKALGFSYDWDREVNTTTQTTIAGLSGSSPNSTGASIPCRSAVNWCPASVLLANEGNPVRVNVVASGHPQANETMDVQNHRLCRSFLEDLELVDWLTGTLVMQKERIGKSFGAEVDFEIKGMTRL